MRSIARKASLPSSSVLGTGGRYAACRKGGISLAGLFMVVSFGRFGRKTCPAGKAIAFRIRPWPALGGILRTGRIL
ncbi:hypothetical protein GCM10007923_07650 [Shinella yambaruensis]|uniref:Uncharacterized protein n=1 Tax=Shinella yambaruensis TaxID=415996 RepID=A0ABQ5ZC14_9HYPH|nr:hypothetical protein GCM10007923_07650 [Shinella yambaruensis]